MNTSSFIKSSVTSTGNRQLALILDQKLCFILKVSLFFFSLCQGGEIDNEALQAK